MKKVLVSTDFSDNSKAGILFAIQWATQQRLALVFVHVLHILRPTKWPDDYFDSYAAEEVAEYEAKLPAFVHDIYRQHGIEPGPHSFLILQGYSADVTIMDYCSDNPGIDFICMATSGAGKLTKIFGTNTGNLITKSEVPVIAVPASYTMAPIEKLMYATDMKRYKPEIKKLTAFAGPLQCSVVAVHFTWPNESSLDKAAIDKDLKKQLGEASEFHFEKNDGVHTLVQNLQEQVKKIKPSVLVMFTNQKRNFFQKLFLSSKAEEFAFKATVPLLVYSKGS